MAERDISPRYQWGLFSLLLVAYLLIGTLYAFYTPDWQAPDEPAHYNYIRQLADGTWPVIEAGDYDQAYQSEVIGSRFAPQYSVEPFEYEDYQPPLYYLLQTPVFLLFNGRLEALRLTSLLLVAGVLLFAFLLARRLWPQQGWLALTAVAFIAFLPQHVAISASVNNDSLAELLIAAMLWLAVVVARRQRAGVGSEVHGRPLAALGILLGLGFLTKATVYILVPLLGLTLLIWYWGEWGSLLRAAGLLFGLAFLLGLPWWLRNTLVYDGLDLLGIAAHNEVVTGQPLTTDWIAERGLGPTLRAFGQTTFQSFWGQFGWMGVPMPAWVYRPLLLFTLLTGAGLIWHGWTERGRFGPQAELSWREKIGRSWSGWLLLGTFMLSTLLYLAYNVTFVQHQGRYLFSSLLPISLGVALGWAAWLSILRRRWLTDKRWLPYLLPLGLATLLLGLDLLALFRFIVPSLSL